MARGVNGCAIYIDDADRLGFLERMKRVESETGASVFAYCLMGNHFHLAIKVGAVPLAFTLQRILTGHSLAFNHRHNREGHLFQARYKAILCATDSYLAGLIRYIHLNPVRAGIVARAEDWNWSSYRTYRTQGREGLIGADADIPDFDPWPAAASADIPDLYRRPPETREVLYAYAASIAAKTGVSVDEMRSGSRRREVSRAKKHFVRAAIFGGHRLTSIADWLSATPSSLARYARENTADKYKPDTDH